MADTPVTFRGFPGALLRYAWDLIKTKHDWKAPIAAVVPGDLVHLVCAAIAFFTATEAAVFEVDGGYIVVADV